ncbi:MAG: malonyl-[acyl-carrier protein] O-methyltransferase BioC [Methylotenera sp. 17-45-7]|jgi:malonyl-CoA O-methyltransferase|nr:MAG: malonyl-[acyl-carrier protein] O-methyltransferase BioC [Mehylophilales bacterium 35-46-6]OZA09896.1 MAG: malonyl-[acyl-carrier protein] O-methyltransferase BioC [Methylotenera sp. 17-45-7]OZA54547.1 MAG: malonyl-[acyl-carrier protein] O-methyltransferase BioC [Methylophilales bacterium 39-45-7]HQS37619.1 malonyl-ACP O-methyltransferase BioC [Methylotenera sp.]
MIDHYHIDKARARRSFGRAAETYDAAAILQKLVREEMLSRLDLVKLNPQVILDAGCGTGLASHALQKRYAKSQVVSLDFAYPMLQKTRSTRAQAGLTAQLKSLFGGAKQNLLCADIESLPLASGSVGMVWSNLAIQWCNDLDAALTEFHRVLQPESLLMFSTFGPDTLRELRTATDAASGNSYTSVSRFIDMHDIGDALVRAGFSAPVLDVERFTLTYDDVKSVMRDLKSIGAHNATDGRARGLMGKTYFAKLEQYYEQFRQAGKLPATFEVVYGHAWRGKDKPVLENGMAPISFKPRNK